MKAPALRQVADELGVTRPESQFVHIEDDVVSRLAARARAYAANAKYQPATWSDPLFWNAEGTQRARSQFFAIGNAINFRFWRLVDQTIVPSVGMLRGQSLRGSMYMWRALRLALDSAKVPLLDAGYLADFSREDLDTVFSDDRGHNPLAVAADDRIENLRDLGRQLRSRWNGEFFNVISAANCSLVAYASLCRQFRAFDDPVYKLTMVNAILHVGSGVAKFDCEPLPGIDYHLLKQLLRHGALKPVDAISAKLASRKLLTADEGAALRRAALWVFVEIASESGVGGQIVDNIWWQNRERCLDERPVCETAAAHECPFLDQCAKLVSFALPLELSRYY